MKLFLKGLAAVALLASTPLWAEPDAVVETAAEEPAPRYRLVLILDDIGNNAAAGMRAVNLPGQVTYAVMPFTPHGKMLAEAAHQAGKEVMLHAPMSNLAGMALGEGGLTLSQPEDVFVSTLRRALADIPHISGLNNHTGSELTAALQPMSWVMQELKQRQLYFVDSMTTNKSVAYNTAQQYQVPSLKRHVFLDNVQEREAIDKEFKRALRLAQDQGFAVAIGHPYPETLAYLESILPALAATGIELAPPSVMLEQLRAASLFPDQP
ncbi:MAG TPA: divergent polysaccharide deacetylase family protein [Pseudohongiella sp.]|nr:divergent polysaccharide deacetylase family protein [Pseudohongiella sp.]